MVSDLPQPMTPPDCDLRGMTWMPVDVLRVMDSDMFALSTGDEFKAAFALWCKSWTQVPAASLPNDDKVLAHLSGAKQWKRVKAKALRNWVMCSDGRYYHPVVAEKAIEAWEGRVEHRETSNNKTQRQQRWREKVKELSAQLRSVGVTPPMNPSLAELELLIAQHVVKNVDAHVDGDASTVDGTVDATETAKRGTGTGRETVRVKNQEDTAAHSGSSVGSPEDQEARRLGLLRDDPEPERPKNKPAPIDAATDIAIALRDLGIKVTSMHPTLLEWIKEGFTKHQIIEAVAQARLSKPKPEVIPPNYITPILRDSKNPKHSTTAEAREAWAKVVQEVRRGAYSKPGFTLGETIDRAVREIGGYAALGRSSDFQLLQFERDFRKAFQQQRAA